MAVIFLELLLRRGNSGNARKKTFFYRSPSLIIMSRISTMISIIQIHDDGNLKFAVFVGEENNNWKATDDDTLKNQPM